MKVSLSSPILDMAFTYHCRGLDFSSNSLRMPREVTELVILSGDQAIELLLPRTLSG